MSKNTIKIEPIGNGKVVAIATDEHGNSSRSCWNTDPEKAKAEAVFFLNKGMYGGPLDNRINNLGRSNPQVASFDSSEYAEVSEQEKIENVSRPAGGGIFCAGWVIVAFLIAGIVFFILNPV